MGSHAALIAKLEEAKEGSRELDYTIRMVLAGYEPVSADAARRADEDGADPAPHYTTNLQDAVDLVPEGWVWHVWGVDDGMPNAEVRKTISHTPQYGLSGCNPALSLCIAILKALEARDG